MKYKFIISLICGMHLKLTQNDFDAVAATKAIFGGEIPRVMQGTGR